MEGSFSKIIAYDSGLIVICSWGIAPVMNEDDAAKAVLAALNIKRSISKFSSESFD
jgi:hypothetical protein